MVIKTFDVELRKIDEIQPCEGNPRINDSAVDAVVASLKEFGFHDDASYERLSDREIRLLITHSNLPQSKKDQILTCLLQNTPIPA